MRTRLAVGAILLIGLVFQVTFGLLGMGRDRGGFDFAYLYVGGLTWLDRNNPYDFETFSAHNVTWADVTSGFAYPPNISIPAMALASIPMDTSVFLFGLLNVGCLCLLAYFTWDLARTQRQHHGCQSQRAPAWPVAAAVMFSPFAANVTHMGQTSTILATTLLASWICAQHGRHFFSGMLMAVAMIKPQIAALPFIWLCASGNWRFLGGVIAASITLCIGALLSSGPAEILHTWLDAIEHYRSISFNVLGNEHVTSLGSLIAAAGLEPLPGIPVVALLLGAILWYLRHRVLPDDILALLLLAGLAFIPAHDYDFIALAPVLVAIWQHLSGSTSGRIFSLCLLGCMYVPQQFLRKYNLPEFALHWRDMLTLVLLPLLAWLSIQARSRSSSETGQGESSIPKTPAKATAT